MQDMFHYVRTAFGDSQVSYGGDIWDLSIKPSPLGLDQRNESTPAIWEIESTPLLNSLREAGFGAVSKCCISKESFKLVGFCFVEISTIIQVSPSPIPPKIIELSYHRVA